MNSVPTPQPSITPARRAAIRGMVLDSIDASAAAAPGVRRRRTVVRFTAIAAAAVVVIGGGGLAYASLHGGASTPPVAVAPPATSDPAPSSTPSSGTQPTSPGGIVDPAGTASPSPVLDYDPDDPSTWVIDSTGVGPLAMDAPASDGRVLLNGAYSVTAATGECDSLAYIAQPRGRAPRIEFSATRTGATAIITIGFVNDSTSQTAALRDASPKTSAGIGVGSTQAQILAAYPGISKIPTSLGDGGLFGTAYGFIGANGYTVAFLLDADGQVSQVSVSYDGGAPAPFC